MSYQAEEQLPFFVYGTLRTGQTNFHLLEGRVKSIRPAYVDGFALYSLGSYPSLIRDDDPRSRVYGEVVTPVKHRYEHVLKALDRLETYDPANPDQSWYLRIPYRVHLNARRTVRVWLYLGRPEHLKMWHKRIKGGDWSQYREQQPFTGRN